MTTLPREKLLDKGAQALSDEELLALFLRTGLRGKNVMELAREILGGSSGIRGLLEMDPDSLRRIPGLGTAKITQLLAIREMARRYLRAQIPSKEAIHSTESFQEYLKLSLQGLKEEILMVIFLSGQNKILGIHELGIIRSPNSAAVPLRELLKRGLACGASAFVLAHNHPHGKPSPSPDDIRVTRLAFFAGRFLGLALYEHLIIGDNDFFSFREAGWIKRLEKEFSVWSEV